MTNQWWQTGVVYQIYPRSFMDSSGDGVGDLAGIIGRLDYLVELGIDAIWISPIFRSPMADFGYDVADYTDIDPLFGDLPIFDRLLAQAHRRGLKVILDYVPNHTSDQHPWFIESRGSRDNPKHDWYIWRDDLPDGTAPNNWLAMFGGSAWEWDETRQQYYLHIFLKQQPDLNWRNPAVKEAMHEVLHFWLKKGVDGFRMDVVTFLMKHPAFPDNPSLSVADARDRNAWDVQDHRFDVNQPEIHERLQEFRALFAGYGEDRVTIGETWFRDPHELATFYGAKLDELHLPFNFMLLQAKWEAASLRQDISAYYAALPQGAQPNFVLGNHDVHRLAARYGMENIRSVALLLLTLRGTPTMYYGDEIGMTDVPIPPDRERDPYGLRVPGLGLGRDPERTPMQWDASPNAGFTTAEPWLPVAENYREVNVAAQIVEPASMLNFYKTLLRLRRQLPALHRGDLTFLEPLPPDVLAYYRQAEDQRLLVILNMGASECRLALPSGTGEILLSTVYGRVGQVELSGLKLAAHEGLLLRMAAG